MNFSTLLCLLWSMVPLVFSLPICSDCHHNCSAINYTVENTEDPVATSSITPWKYRCDNRTDRVPQLIFHANCMDDTCKSLEQNDRLKRPLRAVPIEYKIMVYYKKLCPNKHVIVVPDTLKVTVGCTCIRT